VLGIWQSRVPSGLCYYSIRRLSIFLFALGHGDSTCACALSLLLQHMPATWRTRSSSIPLFVLIDVPYKGDLVFSFWDLWCSSICFLWDLWLFLCKCLWNGIHLACGFASACFLTCYPQPLVCESMWASLSALIFCDFKSGVRPLENFTQDMKGNYIYNKFLGPMQKLRHRQCI
jgi:hypothetical protein